MSMPAFTAEASLYATSEGYYSAAVSTSGMLDTVLAQQLCRHSGQSCGGIDLFCCPGLRCTAGLGGHGICVSNLFHCSQCIGGRQICCPPPGYGLRCFVRSCRVSILSPAFGEGSLP
jgi:hypothetical protein